MDALLAIQSGGDVYPAPLALGRTVWKAPEHRHPVEPAGVAEPANPEANGFVRLQSRQYEMNAQAQALRVQERAVEIRKLFPPYPPEQAERMAYLDNMGGLAKQIEAMLPAAGLSEAQATELAWRFSLSGRQMLAELTSNQALSGNRPLLEAVAQSAPVF